MAGTRNGKKIAVNQKTEMVRNLITSRIALLRSMLDDEGRDLNRECGWPDSITPQQYKEMYERFGPGARVVDLFPDECWTEPPLVYEIEDEEKTPFEEAWDKLESQHQLLARMHRADQISGIGRFGIIVLGVGDKKELKEPLANVDDFGKPKVPSTEASVPFLYARCYDESRVRIEDTDWEKDAKSPRYGLPRLYTVRVGDETSGSFQEQKIHWTRIIHLAEKKKDSEIYATPRMHGVYNFLLDMRKIGGGSAEMFYKGGFPGLAAIGDPTLLANNAQFDSEALRDELEAYQNTLQRVLAVKGADIKTLDSSIADPKSAMETQITLICISIAVPLRIFMGSEQGRLAADQDSKNWNNRVMGRCVNYVTPSIIQATIWRLVAAGCLPTPEDIIVDWPDANAPTDQEKANLALTRTEAMAKYVGGNVAFLMSDKVFLTHILQMTEEEADTAVESVKEMEAEEHRLLGGSEEEDNPDDLEEEDEDEEN